MKRTLLISTVVELILAFALFSVWRAQQRLRGPTEHPSIRERSTPRKLTSGAPSDAAVNRERQAANSASLGSDPPAPNPNLIADICGTNASRELQKLGASGPLSRADCETLCRFLREKTTDEKLERMASIKNSVMNILARERNLPLPWETTLRQIIQDEDQHSVIRDYALQHLFERYEDIPEGPHRKELEERFWEMLQRTQESLAGTALLGLYSLSVEGFGIDAAKLRQSALNLLQGPDARVLSRISALQVCALLEERRALPEALRTAREGETISLRCSAIAAVGALGTRQELPVLRAVGHDRNQSIGLAVEAAIQRIQHNRNG